MGLDYYAILNIPRNSPVHEIKLAYRKWAIFCHPNRKAYALHPDNPPEGVPDAIVHLPTLLPETTWEYVNEAYDVLANPLHREVYDVYGEEGLKRGTVTPNGYFQPYIYHGDHMKTYRDAFGNSSPYVDLIDAVTRPPPLYSTKEGVGVRCKDPPNEIALWLTLKEVFYGGVKKIQIHRHEFRDETKTTTALRDRLLAVPIRAGIQTGCRIVFPEEGDRGPTRFPADIIFIVADRPHDIYRRDGVDLHMVHRVNIFQSLCGFVLEVDTIDDRKLRVPITDVVSPTYTKEIENEGLPFESDSTKKGKLIISFEVEFPTNLNKECREKIAEMFKSGPCADSKNKSDS